MILTMLKAKLHRATVTQCDLHYVGSISIDKDLLAASGILPNEQVDVLNITNGERLTTYAIEAPAGSGMIGLNGDAARPATRPRPFNLSNGSRIPQPQSEGRGSVRGVVSPHGVESRFAHGLRF